MSVQDNGNAADPLEWAVAQYLKDKLFEDGKYRHSAYVVLGMYTGRRIGDLCAFTYRDVLERSTWQIKEQKTSKRTLRYEYHPELKAHIQKVFDILEPGLDEPIVANSRGEAMTSQGINQLWKKWLDKYELGIENASSHTLRKTFGRRVVKKFSNVVDGYTAVMTLFNHSSPSETKKYLGVLNDEINEVLMKI